MISLAIPYRNAIPEIDKGTADLFPIVSHRDPAGGPSARTPAATIYAEDLPDASEWQIREHMAIFPSADEAPLLPADIHPPAQFELHMRAPDARYASLQDFQRAARARASALDRPVAWLSAHGKRLMVPRGADYPDLQRLSSAARGGVAATQGAATWDLFDLDAPSGTPPLGAAFIARTAPDRTAQHWVIFDRSIPFDRIGAIRRALPVVSEEAFLAEIRQRHAASLVGFRHAYEEALHAPDLLQVSA